MELESSVPQRRGPREQALLLAGNAPLPPSPPVTGPRVSAASGDPEAAGSPVEVPGGPVEG